MPSLLNVLLTVYHKNIYFNTVPIGIIVSLPTITFTSSYRGVTVKIQVNIPQLSKTITIADIILSNAHASWSNSNFKTTGKCNCC